MAILLFEDKLGITEGYSDVFRKMCAEAGINPSVFSRTSIWRSELARTHSLLIEKGNRNTPGFNPELVSTIAMRVRDLIHQRKPLMGVCMDAALLGIFNPDWNTSTIDNMRGSVYYFEGIPFLIMTPISAIHKKRQAKDIRAMNSGAENEDEWEESEHPPEELYIEPYLLKSGKWVFETDLKKLHRIYNNPPKIRQPKIRICWSKQDIQECEDFMMASDLIANDIETIPDRALITINGFAGLQSDGEMRGYVFPFYQGHNPETGTARELDRMLKTSIRINESPIPKTYQNGAYDLTYLTRYGMQVANYAYDSMTMFWSLYPELDKDLNFISSIMNDTHVYWKGAGKSDDWETYCLYNGLDNVRTIQSTIELIQQFLRNPAAARNFWRAHTRVILALGMSLRGVRCDEEALATHGIELAKQAEEKLEQFRYVIADPNFNINSPAQKKVLLYKKLGVRMRTARGRFTDKYAEAAANAVVIKAMRGEHPIFRHIAQKLINAQEPDKQISNLFGLTRAQWKPNASTRIYTSYNGVGTGTERLSSNQNPLKLGGNIQNVRKDYRDIITAEDRDDCILLDIDFSASDDVFMSFESGDPGKIDLIRSGRDVHATNATIFFTNWTYDRIIAGKRAHDPAIVHPITGIRQITKKITHGCNYLMAAITLLMTCGREAIVAAAKEIGYADAGIWDQSRLVEFCEYLEKLYRAHYPRFQRSGPDSFYSDLKRIHAATGGFTTPFGYFQRFLGTASDDAVLRAIAATVGQAGTAGRINMAMEELGLGRIPKSFRDGRNPHYAREPLPVSRRNHGISLRLQNHDSLTFNIHRSHSNWQEGVDRILTVMARPVVIRNPISNQLEEFSVKNETEVGFAWGNGLTEVRTNTLSGVLETLKGIPELALQ